MSTKKSHWFRNHFALQGIVLLSLTLNARADTSLFTTQDDWTQWNPASTGIALSAGAGGDTDGTLTNGVGNDSAALSPGTAGGLTVTISPGQTYGGFLSPGEQDNAAFLATLGNSPTLQVDFTYPPGGAPAFQSDIAIVPVHYFDPRLILNFTGTYDQIDPTTVVNQGTFFTATYGLPAALPSAPAAGLTYFQLGFVANTNETGSFQIDNVTAQPPRNVTSMFTTQADWSLWTSGSAGIAPSVQTTGDTDGSIVNGVGNPSNSNQRSTAGALAVTISSGQKYGNVNSPDEHNNPAFLASLAHATTLQLDFTYPTNDSYFEPILLLNFNGNYDQIEPTSIVDDGTFLAATYTLPGGLPSAPSDALTYFQLGIIANTDDTGTFTVDSLSVMAPVPEPAALMLVAAPASFLIARRRKRRNLNQY